MPIIQPFRAFRYAAGLLPSLKKLVCPPYDVIAPEEQAALLRKHPLNFVRVELPTRLTSVGKKHGVSVGAYAEAARLWKRWRADGVMARDEKPALYAYEVSFGSLRTGRPLKRRGFFAALHAAPWGRENVFPHEKTLPTHKADRLKLFKAASVQTSPIQLVYRDPGGTSGRLFSAFARRTPWVMFTDEAGVTHRFWRLDDPAEVAVLQGVLKRTKAVIADGHHRYETLLAFSRWARDRRGMVPACGYVMAYFSPTTDPGLEILPTHRAVGFDKKRFVQLEKWGTLVPVSGLKALGAGLEAVVYHGGRFFRYKMTRVPPILKGTARARLAVAVLHAGALNGLGKEDFFFARKPEAAVTFADERRGWAFFLAPNTVDDVLAVAADGDVMPPKSTYFYPKIPSGVVSRSLAGEL